MSDPIIVSERAIAQLRALIKQRKPTPPELAYRKALHDALDVPKGWLLDMSAGAFVPPKNENDE